MGWFGKKVELEVVGSDGKPKRVKIPERQFNQWAAEGKVHPVECQVHVLDLMPPERLETWIIGKDVSAETWGRFKGKNGHLYVLVHYVDGQPKNLVIPNDIWEKTKRDEVSASIPSSLEEHFNHQHKMLLSSSVDVQAVAAAGMNVLWRGFNLKYPNIETFRNEEESEKTEYLHKFSNMINKMSSDELTNKAPEGTSRGAFLMYLYLIAIGTNDTTMISRIADVLEPFNKMAYDMINDSESSD